MGVSTLREEEIVDTACAVAFEAHRRQVRKGYPKRIVPYIIHPMDVMKRLVNWGIYCPVTLCSAALHDTKEEKPKPDPVKIFVHRCTPPPHDIVPHVVNTVSEELTFIPGKCKWKSKEDYLASFMTASVFALAVKVADRICNTWDWYYGGNIKKARKYYKAANALFVAMIARKGELIEYYGRTSIEAMFLDYDYLRAGLEISD